MTRGGSQAHGFSIIYIISCQALVSKRKFLIGSERSKDEKPVHLYRNIFRMITILTDCDKIRIIIRLS
ncbi:unknown protein [Microcystis aeruginosa NIES-843]|uniref:Uncharacterized protein n=1 Tax=Microcystis aeruginosa (strain NIES-843 / IAM M-2473) TaxID=449447 RepID=B0JXS4_MICAN|nr:unknown protein [Microcystis aeruginosa NIES-843]